MTLYELGKNTKKTEYKVPGEVKKLFENYLKAQKVIDKDTWENVSAELVIVSWLNAFGESEEYKSVMEAAKEKKQNAEKEADEARAAGLTPVNLGPRILRCETAPAYVLSVISYFFEL